MRYSCKQLILLFFTYQFFFFSVLSHLMEIKKTYELKMDQNLQKRKYEDIFCHSLVHENLNTYIKTRNVSFEFRAVNREGNSGENTRIQKFKNAENGKW